MLDDARNAREDADGFGARPHPGVPVVTGIGRAEPLAEREKPARKHRGPDRRDQRHERRARVELGPAAPLGTGVEDAAAVRTGARDEEAEQIVRPGADQERERGGEVAAEQRVVLDDAEVRGVRLERGEAGAVAAPRAAPRGVRLGVGYDAGVGKFSEERR